MKNLLRPCLKNSLRPLYEGLSGIRHPSDSEEGLNRRGARDLDDGDVTATRRTPDGLMRWKHGQSSRQRKHRPASRPHGIKGDLQEGFNRRSTYNLMCKATYRRVLIGVVYATLGEGCRGNTGQLDKDLTVKDTGQLIGRGDTSLVSKRGGNRSPGTGPSLWPPPVRHGRPVMGRPLQAM